MRAVYYVLRFTLYALRFTHYVLRNPHMKPGWYILNYHDISWEENAYERAIGGNFPPDIFRAHVQALSRAARLVSVAEGLRRWQQGAVDEPLVSFWFDDGLAGVRRYALPLLAGQGVTAAMSVCSRFMLRQEFFWRFKLAFLTRGDGLRFLRSRLRPLGFASGMSLRAFTLDHFGAEVLAAIDAVYTQFTAAHDRQDAFRLFDDVAGMAALRDAGWEIANHSAAHYPVSEESYLDHFAGQFGECEQALNAHLGLSSRFWVLPFARQPHLAGRLADAFAAAQPGDRILVLMGARRNIAAQPQGGLLYRFYPPLVDGPGLLRYLRSTP